MFNDTMIAIISCIRILECLIINIYILSSFIYVKITVFIDYYDIDNAVTLCRLLVKYK